MGFVKAISALILGGLPVYLAMPANASVEAFTFTGQCADCTGSVNATLVLENYTVGASFDESNFVSFTYGGSNLLPGGFEYDSGTIGSVTGSFATLPGAFFVYIESSDLANSLGYYSFVSYGDGEWSVFLRAAAPAGKDNGTAGTWSVGGAVPEPSTWALILLGFAGLDFARRRRAPRSAATPADV